MRLPAKSGAQLVETRQNAGSERELGFTRATKVCKMMAFMAIVRGLGPLFYILLGFRAGSIDYLQPSEASPFCFSPSPEVRARHA